MIQRTTAYGFVAGQDYTSISGKVAREGRGAVEQTDHIITLDMAKELRRWITSVAGCGLSPDSGRNL